MTDAERAGHGRLMEDAVRGQEHIADALVLRDRRWDEPGRRVLVVCGGSCPLNASRSISGPSRARVDYAG